MLSMKVHCRCNVLFDVNGGQDIEMKDVDA